STRSVRDRRWAARSARSRWSSTRRHLPRQYRRHSAGSALLRRREYGLLETGRHCATASRRATSCRFVALGREERSQESRTRAAQKPIRKEPSSASQPQSHLCRVVVRHRESVIYRDTHLPVEDIGIETFCKPLPIF